LADFTSLMLVLFRIEDRRLIATLYSGAHEVTKGTCEMRCGRTC
jgi:hypothetical protein